MLTERAVKQDSEDMDKKKTKGDGLRYCMFCGRSENEVPLLLQGLDACICSDCVEMGHQ